MSRLIKLLIIISAIIILGAVFLFPPIMLPLLGLLIFVALIILLPVKVFISNFSFLSQSSADFQHFISILLLLLLIPLEYVWGYISFALHGWPSPAKGFVADVLMNLGNYVAFAMLFMISVLAFKIFRNAEKSKQVTSGLSLLSILNLVIGIVIIGFYLFWLIIVGLLRVNI